MQDKDTAETLDKAIARLNELLGGSYWQIEHSEALFHEWLVAVPLPDGITHPDTEIGTRRNWIRTQGRDLAAMLSDAADKVAEALAMRGAA